MSNGYYIGKIEKENYKYIVYAPYEVVGAEYSIIYDFLESVGIIVENDLCYGTTDDRVSPIIYKQEKQFYDSLGTNDNIKDFSKCIDTYTVLNNELICEDDMIKMDCMGEQWFEKYYPLVCTNEYNNGVRYMINESNVNKNNYKYINKIVDIDKYISDNFECTNRIRSIIKQIYTWIKNNNYVYVYKYY